MNVLWCNIYLGRFYVVNNTTAQGDPKHVAADSLKNMILEP